MNIKDANLKKGDRFRYTTFGYTEEYIFRGPGRSPANFLASPTTQPHQTFGFHGEEEIERLPE